MISEEERERVRKLEFLAEGVGRVELRIADEVVGVGRESGQAVDPGIEGHAGDLKIGWRNVGASHRDADARRKLVEPETEFVDGVIREHLRVSESGAPGRARGVPGAVVASTRDSRKRRGNEPGLADVGAAREDRVARGEVVVQAQVALVGVVRHGRGDHVVVAQALAIRVRIEVDEGLCQRGNSIRRNHVPVERLAGLRVVDDRVALLGEIAGPHPGGRNRESQRVRSLLIRPLEVGEEKRLPAADRPADRSAVLVVGERRLRFARVGKIVAGIERAVVPEQERGALGVVSSPLDRHVDDGAAAAAELRGVVRGLHLEFFDGIDVGLDDRMTGTVVVVVVHAVEHEIRRGGAHPVRDDRVLFARVPVGRTLDQPDSGGQGRQRNEAPAAHRQLLDLLGLDDLAEGALLCLEDRGFRRDDDRFRGGANLERDVDPEAILDAHVDLLAGEIPESRERDRQGVGSDGKAHGLVIAPAVRGRSGRDVGLFVGQRHRRPRQHTAARIAHGPEDCAGIHLRGG